LDSLVPHIVAKGMALKLLSGILSFRPCYCYNRNSFASGGLFHHERRLPEKSHGNFSLVRGAQLMTKESA
jgi:hypothetical protein